MSYLHHIICLRFFLFQLLFWLFPISLKELAWFLRNGLCIVVRKIIVIPLSKLWVSLPSSAKELLEVSVQKYWFIMTQILASIICDSFAPRVYNLSFIFLFYFCFLLFFLFFFYIWNTWYNEDLKAEFVKKNKNSIPIDTY